MKYTTLPKLAIAAVSVISKHIAPAAQPRLLLSFCGSDTRESVSSLSEVPGEVHGKFVNGFNPRPDAMHPADRVPGEPPTGRSMAWNVVSAPPPE